MRATSIIKSIIIIEVIIIIFLGIFLYNKKNKVNVSTIDNSTLQHITTNKFKYFYTLMPNYVATWSATFLPKPITNKYNDDSLNEEQNYSLKKDTNTFRIITLGDSYTYGQNVNTKDNWTEILERKLNQKPICKNINKFEVINLGAPGYDIQYESRRYELTGQKYNPDLIIWMLTEIERLNEKKMPLEQECWAKKNNKTFNKNIDCWYYAVDSIKKEYGVDYVTQQQRNSILDLQKIYNKNIFFIDFYNTHQSVLKNLKNNTIFSKLATNEFLYNQHLSSQVYFPDAHPNELGHQLIADIIFDQLFKTNQIPCKILEQK